MNETKPQTTRHPETDGELLHYEWNGWMWCEREHEATDWPDLPAKCPLCGMHVPDL